MTEWHHLDTAAVLQRLESNEETGLSSADAQHRLETYGPNELVERPTKSPWVILWEQVTDTMVVVLIVAAIASGFLGDYKEAIAILAIVIFSTLLGFFQEYRAVQAFAALKRMAVPIVKVLRGGDWQSLSARDLVRGDIVQLEAGNQVPADCRMLESADMRVLEAAFTGESEPIEKSTDPISPEVEPGLADRYNMVYRGTVVTYGRGRAVVTATGMSTELGKLADQIQSVEPEMTPLQRRLNLLGKQLAIAAFVLVAIIFGLGVLRGGDIEEMLLTGVSLAVAVIPESLAAVVTIALALGSQQMLRRNALVRKLNAVETLGSVTVICSDKTGTLTQNLMTVTVLDVAGQRIHLTESLMRSGVPVIESPSSDEALRDELAPKRGMRMLLTAASLCTDVLLPTTAILQDSTAPLGDPTEIALVVAATRLGLHKPTLERFLPRVAEVPFDSDRKRMTTVHDFRQVDADILEETGLMVLATSPYIAFTKGGVASLLEVSTHVWVDGRIEPMTESWQATVRESNHALARMGNRVLGVALRLVDAIPDGLAEENLVFVGVMGMMDPPRPEVKLAIETCLRAGIRPVMITGDQVLTAQHIAQELGIAHHNDEVLTGKQLNKMYTRQLEEQVEAISVYARVAPDQKLKIVQALQNRGHLVAMTGDGVNDAPALKKADIGVAMGITGTDVAKEAADVVLLDDNFATIVAAVEQGRVIFDNIRKFIRYSMTGNASSLWLMMLAPLLLMPLPLWPLQILWINLLADGLLSLALSFEPAERNTMDRPPYPPNANIFNREIVRDIVWVGMLIGLSILILGYSYWRHEQPQWQTMVFATLAFSRMSLALAMRSQRDPLIHMGLLTNRQMLAAVVLTFLLQLSVLYVPWFQTFFRTTPLTGQELLISLLVSTVGFWAVELKKWFLLIQRKDRRSHNLRI
jgi:Ca2+-transporting ATPase